jgi:hypothetical protein
LRQADRLAQFLCSSQGPFLRPGPQNVDRVARRERSRPAVALGLRLAPALPGGALTAPSTARGFPEGSRSFSISRPRTGSESGQSGLDPKTPTLPETYACGPRRRLPWQRPRKLDGGACLGTREPRCRNHRAEQTISAAPTAPQSREATPPEMREAFPSPQRT